MFAFGSVSAFKRTLLPSYSKVFSYATSLRREAWSRIENAECEIVYTSSTASGPPSPTGKADAEFRIIYTSSVGFAATFPSDQRGRLNAECRI